MHDPVKVAKANVFSTGAITDPIKHLGVLCRVKYTRSQQCRLA